MYEPGIVIRPVEKDDLPKLVDMVKRFYLFNEEFNPFMELSEKYSEFVLGVLEERLSNDSIFLVAINDEEIAGYVYGVIEINKLLRIGKIALIKELYVSPIYRNRGIASRLLEEFSLQVRKEDVQVVAAEFPASNYIARNFYEKNGFKEFRSIYMKVL